MRDFDKIVFLDVETPNYSNDRICSLGYVAVDTDRNVLEKRSLLIDPETFFYERNIEINGITPVAVKGKPNFSQVWQGGFGSLVEGALLVAHNATFDLSVLAKDMAAYGISAKPSLYACTKELASNLCPDCRNYKLPTVCDYLGIGMGPHHRALSDAEGCERIFWALVGDEIDNVPLSEYDWLNRNRGCKPRSIAPHPRCYSDKTEACRELKELVGHVAADGIVATEEAMAVLEFIERHPLLESDPCASQIGEILAVSLADGDVSEDESSKLLDLFNGLVNPVGHVPAGDISYMGKLFCLSGEFEHGTKSAIQELIESRGGECIKSVTKKCSYVVVGNSGNENWTMGSYGQKVKKAMEYQTKGLDISIIDEDSLFV